MSRIIPLILCGGSGTRLWPLSRKNHPKQFVSLENGNTLFGEALIRGFQVCGDTDFILSGNKQYRYFMRDELTKHKMKGTIILEPASRNTAPAIALGAFCAMEKKEDSLILVLPSDHLLGNVQAFSETIKKAALQAEKNYLVTFGIAPMYPATGFGYIQAGEKLADDVFKVDSFVEKPAKETAEKMLEKGNYYWNAGMFLLRPSFFLEELKKWSPEIFSACEKSWKGHAHKGDIIFPDMGHFIECPENSIDYAVMEHTGHACVIPLNCEWNDLGSWDAFFQNCQPDSDNNKCIGDVILDESQNCQVYSRDRLVTAVGVEGLSIIETGDAVLVSKKGESQRIKKLVGSLKDRDKYQYKNHKIIYRPWGHYETLAQGDRFQVKRLVVNPGQVLSLQYHHHRAEHWVIVSGTAKITVGDTVKLYTENQSTYIPLGCQHRLENPGLIPLVVIEIQSGPYLGEEDITRLEDIYGRDCLDNIKE